MIVNVHYIDEKTGTIRSSGTYSYRCSIPNASVGMEVIAPTAKREARAVICEINVPESRIDERILPLLKEITQEAPTDGK
ncbi:MAG: hypothetical protein MR590_05350 [Clostridiales bacterium]|nr:hypothetical protein [Clostridiales bacterium]